MMQAMKLLIITTSAAALMFAAPAGAFAQSSHEGHHPGGEDTSASPSPGPQSEGAAPMQKGGMGCMMGGKDMPMMKMMQEMHGKMMGGGMAMQPKGDTGPASQALNGIIAKMHGEMTLPFSGNADVDFVRRMISHDQGAVDMAKVVLAFGKDETVKKIAEEVIRTNEAYISTMQAWLKQQGR